MSDNKSKIDTWSQGKFIEQKKDAGMSKEEKKLCNFEESFLVRSYPLGTAICRVFFPEHAKWIARRLNKCATIEAKIEHIIMENDSPRACVEKIRRLIPSKTINL